MMSKSILFIALLFVVLAEPLRGTPRPVDPDQNPGGEIKVGKWVGFLQVDGQSDAIAATMDSYLRKPEAIDAFPREVLVFKLGLGGYFGPEYQTETFDDLQYDFSQGRLTLDQPANEMKIRAVVYSGPNLHLRGRVYLRSSARFANLYLRFLTDEPGGGSGGVTIPPLVPALAGQYEGTCGTEQAVLQIETGKGLTDETPVPSAGLAHYRITGVLGATNGLCPRVNPPDRPRWCVDHAFSSATYDYFLGNLVLNGGLESDTCTRSGSEWNCRMHLLPRDSAATGLIHENCHFKKAGATTVPFQVFNRRYHVTPTAEQNRELPDWQPPASRDLVADLGGSFWGYLHHEYQDRYQPMRIDVDATTSTVTPHVENQVFVSANAVLFVGRGVSSTFWSQPYDRQTFYNVPGFQLHGSQTDSYLQVTRWRRGYLSGVWYSAAFGRVGTFELVKSTALPALAAQAQVIADVGGEFRGPADMAPDYLDFTAIFPRQPQSSDVSYLVFQGNSQLFAGGTPWPVQRIYYGAYDFYTGAISWMSADTGPSEPTLISGTVRSGNVVNLFWPNERSWAVGIFDRADGAFHRVND